MIIIFFDKKKIEEALTFLGELLEDDLEKTDPLQFEIVVCGGSALTMLNLNTRRFTKDIDILAQVQFTKKGVEYQSPKMPPSLDKAVQIVAEDWGHSPDWMNDEMKNFRFKSHPFKSLPNGLEKRWKKKNYGSRLTIFFIGRYDLIHLKLLAATDPKAPEKHLQDLMSLNPNKEEIKAAANWCKEQGIPNERLKILEKIIKDIR